MYNKNTSHYALLIFIAMALYITGQFTDIPTRSQSTLKLVNSRTSQLAEMLDLIFGV